MRHKIFEIITSLILVTVSVALLKVELISSQEFRQRTTEAVSVSEPAPAEASRRCFFACGDGLGKLALNLVG